MPEPPVEQPPRGGELVAAHVQEHADHRPSAAHRRHRQAVAGGRRRPGLDADRAASTTTAAGCGSRTRRRRPGRPCAPPATAAAAARSTRRERSATSQADEWLPASKMPGRVRVVRVGRGRAGARSRSSPRTNACSDPDRCTASTLAASFADAISVAASMWRTRDAPARAQADRVSGDADHRRRDHEAAVERRLLGQREEGRHQLGQARDRQPPVRLVRPEHAPAGAVDDDARLRAHAADVHARGLRRRQGQKRRRSGRAGARRRCAAPRRRAPRSRPPSDRSAATAGRRRTRSRPRAPRRARARSPQAAAGARRAAAGAVGGGRPRGRTAVVAKGGSLPPRTIAPMAANPLRQLPSVDALLGRGAGRRRPARPCGHRRGHPGGARRSPLRRRAALAGALLARAAELLDRPPSACARC